MIAGVSGRPGDQRVLAHQAAELAAGCGLEDVVGEVHSALGLALLADRDPEGALPLLARGATVMRAWGQPTELIRSLVDLASALTSTLQFAAATAALDEAVSIADSCVDPGALPERVADIAASLNMIALGRHNLTDREVEIVELLRDQLSEREIADRLFISFNTVHTHVRSIYRKLGAETRSDAVERAVRVGALTSDLT